MYNEASFKRVYKPFSETKRMQSHHLHGEAILRLSKNASKAPHSSKDRLTGAGAVDKILRTHHVRIVEPVFKSARDRSTNELRLLYRVVTDNDEDLRNIVADLRNHPDVKAITLRRSAHTF